MTHRRLAVFIASLAVMLTALLTQPTVAYYTVWNVTSNVITSGEISIIVVEKIGDEDFPEGGYTVMPGDTVPQKVSVKNDGGHPCWLRVKVKSSIRSTASAVSLSAGVVQPVFDSVSWIDGGDGYYYYNKILMPNAETEPLITSVGISTAADNRYIGSRYHLIVTALAVQSENNSAYSTPLDVTGWPAEQ